jgi:ATP-dependent exoDNAse (exonuclease V) alpha subunit
MAVSPDKLKELLAKAKAAVEANKRAALEQLEQTIEAQNVTAVDFTGTGISNEAISSGDSVAEEAAIDLVRDVAETLHSRSNVSKKLHSREQEDRAGVARAVILNEKQQQFLDLVVAGGDTVLIGAAGTGKTTSMRQTTRALIDSGRLPYLSFATKHMRVGSYGAAIVSYTRKAVNNIRHAVVDELKANVLTIHKLLEFSPVFYEVEDQNTGDFKKTMRFEPTRTKNNPLPAELVFIAYEESSMIACDLYHQLQCALPHPHQEVFLGDIQQLPPIFGMSILGFKMLELQVVELTEVYRQALNSPIITLAWALLGGDQAKFSKRVESFTEKLPNGSSRSRKRVPALVALEADNEYGTLKFQPWQDSLEPDKALYAVAKQFTVWADQGYYNPEQDVILCPFNKALGTIELNKCIAQHLGKKRGATIYEVMAGFNKHYLAVGDRVLLDKEDAIIESINRNGEYLGKAVQPASIHLDRWGHLQEKLTEDEILRAETDADMDLEAIERFMEAATDEATDRVQSSSHIVVVRYTLTDETVTLSKAAEINALLGGYAMTVYKAQGSEWERVFILMHKSHAVANSREMLYTAVTRARKFLHIICEPDTFFKGVRTQKIKGNSLQEKAEYFKGKGDEKSSSDEDQFDIEWTLKHGGEFDPMKYGPANATGRSSTIEAEFGDDATPTYYRNMEGNTNGTDSNAGDVGSVVGNGSGTVGSSGGLAARSPEQAKEQVKLTAMEMAKKRIAELKARKGLL